MALNLENITLESAQEALTNTAIDISNATKTGLSGMIQAVQDLGLPDTKFGEFTQKFFNGEFDTLEKFQTYLRDNNVTQAKIDEYGEAKFNQLQGYSTAVKDWAAEQGAKIGEVAGAAWEWAREQHPAAQGAMAVGILSLIYNMISGDGPLQQSTYVKSTLLAGVGAAAVAAYQYFVPEGTPGNNAPNSPAPSP